MKKMLLLPRWPCLLQDVSNRRLPFKTNRSSTKGNHHLSFSVLTAEENCRCSQNLWRQKAMQQTETQQTFVNGLLGFITLGIYTRQRVCIAHNTVMSCPSIWATLSALLINILLGSFQLFLHSDQLSSEGEISRSAVSASRGGCIIHAGGGGGFTH